MAVERASLRVHLACECQLKDDIELTFLRQVSAHDSATLIP
jgi:hypothetical protein